MSENDLPNGAALEPIKEPTRGGRRAGRGPGRLVAASARRAAHDEGEDWMLTYTDVVTLLIALFVMLLSYALINEEKYRRMASALSSAVRGPQAVVVAPLPGAGSAQPGPAVAVEPEDAKDDGGRSRAVADDLKKGIAGLGLADQVGVEVRRNQVQLDIKANVLFPTGQSDLTDEGRRVLAKLAPVLQKGAYRISVEGHTDDVPIATERFPSNWELSAGRATTVVRHLIERGVGPKRLQAVGHAEMHPVADNADDDGRQKNRRVNLRLTFEGEEK